MPAGRVRATQPRSPDGQRTPRATTPDRPSQGTIKITIQAGAPRLLYPLSSDLCAPPSGGGPSGGGPAGVGAEDFEEVGLLADRGERLGDEEVVAVTFDIDKEDVDAKLAT